MKIVTIVGARPQFIKASMFSKVFRSKHSEILVHTGQHYDNNMSKVFFDELKIPSPDYNLEVGSLSHGKQTAFMIERIENVLIKENPDAVLVYGDTNSTLAGAIAASKLSIPLIHVEAGLRSFNKAMPEEQNRVLTDHISDILFCPTQTAVNNLVKESIVKNVYNVGDIMYDSVLYYSVLAENSFKLNDLINYIHPLKKTNQIFKDRDYYLATIHRAENTKDSVAIRTIFAVFNKLDKPVVFPVHPRTYKLIKENDISLANVILVEPVGYLLMLFLTSHAKMIITDSGGLQKEAYMLKTPCTTLRNQTEWIETLIGEWNVLSKIEENEMESKIKRDFNPEEAEYGSYFGKGDTALRIAKIIEKEILK